MTLTVTPVNDAPVGVTGSFTTPVNTPYSGFVVATDVDGNPLTYTITTAPTKGTLSREPGDGRVHLHAAARAQSAPTPSGSGRTTARRTQRNTRIDIVIQ